MDTFGHSLDVRVENTHTSITHPYKQCVYAVVLIWCLWPRSKYLYQNAPCDIIHVLPRFLDELYDSMEFNIFVVYSHV